MKILRSQITLTCLLAIVTLAPSAFAVSPPPDGGYPNNTTAEGTDALFRLTTGTDNTAVGFNALYSNTGNSVIQPFLGSENTAVGSQALYGNTTGYGNTAIGFKALYFNTTGFDNTANGIAALFSNTTGIGNTANGFNALFSNTTGDDNTATGVAALASNTTGNSNTANGGVALASNTTGIDNTASGDGALFYNTTGNGNTANGFDALLGNTTGNSNTANGYYALFINTTGNSNTAIGNYALKGNTIGLNNTAVGNRALFCNTTGGNNVALGNHAGQDLTTGYLNIDIGNPGVKDESNTIRIGRQGTQTSAYVAGISGTVVPQGVAVIVDSSGHLGTVVSSALFKDKIQPMDKASEAILSLQPVTFRYKKELDPAGIPQFGLVAEEVAKVNPDLVARDKSGKPYTVRYEAVNAMLLNEFLKAHRRIDEQTQDNLQQEATIAALKSALAQQQHEIESLTASLKEQAAQIQKVSDQVAADKPARRMVVEN